MLSVSTNHLGRESSHGAKRVFNPTTVLPLLLEAIVALPFAGLGLPEQAMGLFPGIGCRRLTY